VTGAIVKGGAIQSIRGREAPTPQRSGRFYGRGRGRAAVHAHDSRIKDPTGEFDPAFGKFPG